MMIMKISNFLKTLWFRFLLWIKPPKLGNVQVDIQQNESLQQPLKKEYDKLDVIEADWEDTINKAFDKTLLEPWEEIPIKPDQQILNEQIRMFYKDYSALIKRQNETFIPNNSKYD